MAKGTSKVPTWLSNLWKGALAIVTLPINLVVRLVERLVVGKEGVQEHDKKIEEMEKKEAEARQEKAKAKFEEESIEEAIEDADLSFDYGDLAIAEVEVDVTEEFGADRMYSITCDNGEGYTIFRSEDGLLRTEHCPAEVEEQLAKLLELAEVRHREVDDTEMDGYEEELDDSDAGDTIDSNDEISGSDSSTTENSREESEKVLSDEDARMLMEMLFGSEEDQTRNSTHEEEALMDGLLETATEASEEGKTDIPFGPNEDKRLFEAALAEMADEAAHKAASTEKSFRFDNLSADVSVNITPLASGAHKALCVCTTKAGEFRIEAERDSDGLIVINSTGDKIKPDLASAMKKAVMSTYSEIPCKMDAGFIDKVHDILSDAMNNGSTQLIGVAYGHTLFTPDISGKCARVSSDRTLGKGNKPKDVSLGARQSVDEIKREIAGAYTKVESAVVGGGLPDSHYTTQGAAYLVRHYNGKPEIVSYNGTQQIGDIKSDRALSEKEIQSINDYLAKTRIVDATIHTGSEDIVAAKEQLAADLDPCGDSSLVCYVNGLYAYVEQAGLSSVLHVGAVDGSLPDVCREVSEGDDIEVLVGELIDETRQSGSKVIATGKAGEKCSWTLDATGHLRISGSGAMYDCESVRGPKYIQQYASEIDRITVEEGITKIGKYAFASAAVQAVEIGPDVSVVGVSAFAGCENLDSIDIPSNVEKISACAFSHSGVRHVFTHEGLKMVGPRAFGDCERLADIILPSSVEMARIDIVANTKATIFTHNSDVIVGTWMEEGSGPDIREVEDYFGDLGEPDDIGGEGHDEF